MMTKTQWLDWVEASTDRLQQRYRQAWTRLPRAKREHPQPESKPWSMMQPEVDREAREVVVHLELPEPHTVEAEVRVIGSTLSIAVLRTGTGIHGARAQDCYRRSIPLPPEVDPGSAVHKVHGDELVIRLQPEKARQTSRRSSTSTRQRTPRTTTTASPRKVAAARVNGRSSVPVKRQKRARVATA